MDKQAEEKFIKRIGWITLYNRKILEKLENWQQYFDLEKYTPYARFDELRRIPGLIEGQKIFENITPTVGFSQVTKAMTGNIAALTDIIVNVHAMGTSNTSPSNGDTQLGAETVRKVLTSKTFSNNRAYYTIFYAATEAVGTFAEIGLFINGNPSVANSGVLWDRSLLSITKSNTQTLTIDYEDTFANG